MIIVAFQDLNVSKNTDDFFSLFKVSHHLSENVVSYTLIFASCKIEIHFIYSFIWWSMHFFIHQLNLYHLCPQQDQKLKYMNRDSVTLSVKPYIFGWYRRNKNFKLHVSLKEGSTYNTCMCALFYLILLAGLTFQ